MAFRSAVQPHLVKRPCRICGRPTQALQRGVLMDRPVCDKDRLELDRQFRVASLQRARQEARR